MDIVQKLEDQLLSSNLKEDQKYKEALEKSLHKVKAMVDINEALAVVSNLANNTSEIIVGAFGQFFGLTKNEHSSLDSIWEEDIFNRIHPDDLLKRHLLELEFYTFLEQQAIEVRLDYTTHCKIRALDQNGNYQYIIHQTSYLNMDNEGKVWLALCLYYHCHEQAPQHDIDGMIINRITGEKKMINQYDNCTTLLSKREKNILSLVSEGLLSKEIASKCHISINTVNRHRQNIISKLNVNNSLEAVRVANALGILKINT